MSGISFIKMHGLGNDFVIIDLRAQKLALDPALIRRITGRHRGVGGDMLITMEPARDPRARIFMGIYNADGGEVDACGNATRCIARLIMEETGKRQTVIETNAGLLQCWAADGGLITVDMGAPKFEWQDIPLEERMDTRGVDIKIGPIDNPVLAFPSVVNVGNPHCVFFVPDVGAHDPARIGPLVENHMLFPERANVSFAQIRTRNNIRLRVWERGVGVTQACGTAACAVVAAAARKGKNLTDRKVTVELDGGVLEIDWREADDHIYMTGPAALSFSGTLAPELLAAP
ncbi:MAG TPA: diaminopimelate epimerase [Alphaproteobacteria bacterium]|nr:diaminopimelate epimerase [Alphaproteobacteria bacterium]